MRRLPDTTIKEVQRHLAKKVPWRKIAAIVAVSLASIWRIRVGKLTPVNSIIRCQKCRHWVQPPCLACALRHEPEQEGGSY